MGEPKRLGDMGKQPGAALQAVRDPKVSSGMNSLSSLPTEHQLGIVHHLSHTSLPTICLLNKRWRNIGMDELLRRVFPISPREYFQCENKRSEVLLHRAIRHFIDTNNAGAMQQLLDFRPK